MEEIEEFETDFVAITKELKDLLEMVPDIGVGERKTFIESYFRTKGLLEQNKRLRIIDQKVKQLFNERKAFLHDTAFANHFCYANRRVLHEAICKYEEELEELGEEE